jgi:opacity protein-like surface antigen
MLKSLSFIIIVLFCFINTAYSQLGYGSEVSGILAIPTGKDASIYNVGFGGLAGFYYDVDDKIRLSLVIGFIRLGVNNDELNNKLSNANQGSANINGSTTAIPVILSFRLITPGPKMRFYGLLEAGIYTYWSKAEGTYFPGDGEVPIDKSEFRSEPGFTAGGGMLFPLNEELNIDFNVRYTFVQDSEYLNLGGTSVATSQMLLLGVGVNWFFPL